jgi:hypothetical protein
MSDPPTDTAAEFELWSGSETFRLELRRIRTHSAYVAVQRYAEVDGFSGPGTMEVYCRELPDGVPVRFEVTEVRSYRARPIEPNP